MILSHLVFDVHLFFSNYLQSQQICSELKSEVKRCVLTAKLPEHVHRCNFDHNLS